MNREEAPVSHSQAKMRDGSVGVSALAQGLGL